jgi:hypothetical protein
MGSALKDPAGYIGDGRVAPVPGEAIDSWLEVTAGCRDATKIDKPHPHGLSTTALSAIAGILKHAPALAALIDPTIDF